MIHVQFPGHHSTHELWPHDSNLLKINDPIRTQFCTCHNSLAVVTCANLWPDWIITIEIKAETISTIFQLWFHKVFVKWVLGHSHLFCQPAVISIFSRGLILWDIMEILQFAFPWGDSRRRVYQQYLSIALNPWPPELFVRNMNVYVHFYPRPVLAFGYCRCLRPSVSPSVRPRVCPRDNSSPVQARITKFGP